MNYREIRKKIDLFIREVREYGMEVNTYEPMELNLGDTSHNTISIQLNGYKGIVLGSETGLELGGMKTKSFSLIYPVEHPQNEICSDLIHLIGPEINELQTKQISFCLFILLTVKDLTEEIFEEVRNLSFVSNSIAGFTIRSIPRRFWCRISQNIIEKGFSFRFLGEAIISLYKQKFGSTLNSRELLMINSSPKLIEKWSKYTEEMRADLNSRWRAKVDAWKKRIDCDYEWACKICPYFSSCKSLQEVLERRRDLET